MEAHWDLGQAYEQMGEVTAAVKEYRTLAGPEGASPATQSSYAERALHRIEALRVQQALSAGSRSGHTALYVSFNNLPLQSQVETWMRQLSAQGSALFCWTPARNRPSPGHPPQAVLSRPAHHQKCQRARCFHITGADVR